jgi:hypothetical protein
MAAPDVIAGRQQELLKEILDIADQLDPEAAERITRLLPNGAMPNSFKTPDEYALVVAEALNLLYRNAAPKRRGRPRKQEAS